MTYQDLADAVARMANDPRCHPTTRVEVAFSYENQDLGLEHESEPLCAISLHAGRITLACGRHGEESAIAR